MGKLEKAIKLHKKLKLFKTRDYYISIIPQVDVSTYLNPE